MKKIISIVAMLLCMVMLLAACANPSSGNETTPPQDSQGNTPSDSSSSNTPSQGDNDAAFGTIVENGKAIYTIIRAESMESALVESAVAFRSNINSGYKTTIGITSDWSRDIAKGEAVENDALEILIGATNRRESIDTLATLKENQYVVKWVGKKLVVIGYDDYATNAALRELNTNYIKSGDVLSLAADFSISGTASAQKILITEGADIRIMTYNLAGTTKEWDDRKANIPESILYYLPDVIGMQECNKTVHNTLSSKELSKYYAVNVRTHSNNSTYNYTPILYRKDKYTNVESGVEFLRQRYTRTNTKSLSWAVLERKSDGQRFIVVNMHGALWTTSYNDYLPAGETYESMREIAKQWRVDNALQMLEKITELQSKYGSIPAFTTGDYNFNKNEAAYTTMKSTGLSSSQETAKKSSTGGSYHNEVGAMPSSSGLPIDHIFYFDNLSSPFCYIIGTTKTDLNATDHCPVYADFKLVK